MFLGPIGMMGRVQRTWGDGLGPGFKLAVIRNPNLIGSKTGYASLHLVERERKKETETYRK